MASFVRATDINVGDRLEVSTDLEGPQRWFNVVRVDTAEDAVYVGVESCNDGLRNQFIFQAESELLVVRA